MLCRPEFDQLRDFKCFCSNVGNLKEPQHWNQRNPNFVSSRACLEMLCAPVFLRKFGL